eukprot:m.223445 g.223445  ORF g.223445 m.223445 type:complete len:1257 (-) comp17269_c0_seq1:2684-6454(-)
MAESELSQSEVAEFALKASQSTKPIGTANVCSKQDAETFIRCVYRDQLDAVERRAPKFQLVVTIVNCRSLIAKYRKQTSHPFVTATYLNSMRRTFTLEDTLNPDFDCELRLPLTGSELQAPVKISVWCDLPDSLTEEEADTISISSSASRFTAAPWSRSTGNRSEGKVRFLGQAMLKPKMVLEHVQSQSLAELELQKRSPRSHVKGTVTVGFKLETINAPREATEDTEYDSSPVWTVPSQLEHKEQVCWQVCHDILDTEAQRIDAEDVTMASQARSVSIPAQRCLDACLGRAGEGAGRIQLILMKEYVATLKDNPHAELEWPQMVTLLSFMTHQVSFKPVNADLSECLACLRMSEGAATGIAEALDQLLEHMQVDMEQYKFQFAAHAKIVPPIFDHFLRVFVLAQRLLKYLRSVAQAAEERLTQALLACKSRIFKLVWASAQAEAPDDELKQHHIMCEMIEAEFRYDLLYYAGHLQRNAGIDLVTINVMGLCQPQAEFCREMLEQGDFAVDPPYDIFDLLHKMRGLKSKYVIPLTQGPAQQVYDQIYRWFTPFVIDWLKDLARKGATYAQRAFDLDDFQPLSDRALHSSVVLDVMTFLTQSLYEVTELQWDELATAGSVYQLFAEIVVGTMHAFVGKLKARFAPSAREPHKLSPELCVAINDVAQMTDGILDFENSIETFLMHLEENERAERERQELAASLAEQAERERRPTWRRKISARLGLSRNEGKDMLAPPSDSEPESEIEDDGNDRKMANINPIVTVKQSLKLSLEELSSGLIPMLDGLIATLTTTVDQYLSFLLGFRKSKPMMAQVFNLQKRPPPKAVFGPSHVMGLSERKMDKVKTRMERMMRDSRRATWKRHESKPSSLVERVASKAQRSREEAKALLDEGQIRITMEPLLDFMDESFQLLSDNLYEDVFNHVLARLWDSVLDLVHRKLNTFKSGVMNSQQAATLLSFLQIIKVFFSADGQGLPSEVLENRAYQAMGDQLRLCRHSTQDIMWMYHQAQADKIIQGDSLTKPTISYKVCLLIGSGLHLEDELNVTVFRCGNLPGVGSRNEINAQVIVTSRQVLANKQTKAESQSTAIIPNSPFPNYDAELAFKLHSLKGTIHLAVYHVDGRKKTFLGEASCNLDDMDQFEHHTVTCDQPLVPMLDRKAHSLLKVLASRKGESDAQEFVQLRIGEIRGRGEAGGSSKSKLHVVNGHFFRATRFALPPACSICQSLIFGLGKAVYECELCYITVHKKCHVDVGNCVNGTKS